MWESRGNAETRCVRDHRRHADGVRDTNPKVDMTNVDRVKYDADLQECRDQSGSPFKDV